MSLLLLIIILVLLFGGGGGYYGYRTYGGPGLGGVLGLILIFSSCFGSSAGSEPTAAMSET